MRGIDLIPSSGQVVACCRRPDIESKFSTQSRKLRNSISCFRSPGRRFLRRHGVGDLGLGCPQRRALIDHLPYCNKHFAEPVEERTAGLCLRQVRKGEAEGGRHPCVNPVGLGQLPGRHQDDSLDFGGPEPPGDGPEAVPVVGKGTVLPVKVNIER